MRYRKIDFKMIKAITSLVLLLFSEFFYGQGIDAYKDIINIDDDYTILKSNISEISSLDVGYLWVSSPRNQPLGFIGSNYTRLRIKFLSIVKDSLHPNRYLVYGETKVLNNVCTFHGQIEVKISSVIKTLERPDGTTGILAGKYLFYEDSLAKYSGIFRGRFVTYWLKDKNGYIQYDDSWSVSDTFNNNQFAGTWVSYSSSNKKVACWGDGRIPQCGDLDVGTAEFAVNEKYQTNGWESYVKMWSGGYSDEEVEKAKQEEAW